MKYTHSIEKEILQEHKRKQVYCFTINETGGFACYLDIVNRIKQINIRKYPVQLYSDGEEDYIGFIKSNSKFIKRPYGPYSISCFGAELYE